MGPAPPSVLDVRWQLNGPPGREEYLEGHIPGAAFVDLEVELAGPPGASGRHPLPEATVFERAMCAAGVSGDRAVVVYDAGGAAGAAARAWWTLRYFGHPSVAVLDGGLAAWEGPVETRGAGGARARRLRRAAGRDAGARRGRARQISPKAASCSTPARPSATAATWSRSTRWRVTSRAL